MCILFFLQSKTSSTKGPLHQLLSGRTSSDGQPTKSNSLGRNVASFDAKFAAVPPMQPDVGVGVASGRGQASSGSVSGVLSSGGSSGHGSSSDEADHTLTGSWELLWESRLQKSKIKHCLHPLSVLVLSPHALEICLLVDLLITYMILYFPVLHLYMHLHVILYSSALNFTIFCSCLCQRFLQPF